LAGRLDLSTDGDSPETHAELATLATRDSDIRRYDVDVLVV
jgi:hypothetical protein